MRYIGKETKRINGDQIVTGKAKYTGDFKLPNMHYGKILRSPHPFAKILEIDYSRASELRGVKKIITYKDVDPNIFITNGFTPPKHYQAMSQYVRFIGDAVALVVAETEDIANEAISLIDVKYEVLKPVFTIDEALADDAPQLYECFDHNIAPHKMNLNFEIGDIEKGFEEADVIVEKDTLLKSGQNPLPVEAPVIIANWENGILNFIASAAAPAYCHDNVAASMNMRYEDIRLIAPMVGGSFGSKLYSGNVQVLVYAGIMSMLSNVPVYFCYSKEEHLAVHQNRMVTKTHVKLGIKKDGTCTAVRMQQEADAGCCATTQEFMLQVGTGALVHLCNCPNKKYDGKVVVTNHMPSGSFRGYGYLESTLSLTSVLHEACRKAGVDMVDYYYQNALEEGTEFYNAMAGPHYWEKNSSANWKNVVKVSAEKFGWKDRFKGWGVPTWVSEDGRYVRGVGVGAAGQCDTGGKPSNANVTITALGSVYISSNVTEFGAGAREAIQKICAEALDIDISRVRLSDSDTGCTPSEFGSTASRTTYCAGDAVKKACEDLIRKLKELCHEKRGIPVDDLEFHNGVLNQISNPDVKIPLFPFLMGKVDSVTGCGHHDGIDNSTIYNVQYVEVELDKKLGTFKIIDHFCGTDCGVIVNPLPARNQMESFFAGIDIACMEETVWDPNDYRVLNPSNIDYKVRTFNDAPKHDHIIIEGALGKEKDHPFGANGIGEPMIAPGAPAIKMALYNCGVNVEDYPFTPAKILAALKEAK